MRKFLSLVMALVMMMTLVTVSAGAKEFTDDEEIQYLEAVEVISEIGVVDGYANGTFGPSNGLTRQAAAKIICNMILGPTTAAELHADTAPYPDVPITNEFAGYIAYCKEQGIISGYADGTFKGGNPLTGYAFMKMLLGALGYDSGIEGYTGENWSINVAKQAIGIGLNDGLVEDFNGVDHLTREEACLYAFNTLKADMVEYDSITNITVGGATVAIAGSEEQKIPYSDNKDYRDSYRAGNPNNGEDGYLQFCEEYFPNLWQDDTAGRMDDFLRPAVTWYKKNDKIGTYTKAADATYYADVKAKTIYTDLDLSTFYTFDVAVDGDWNNRMLISKRDNQAFFGSDADIKLANVIDDGLGTRSDIVGNGSLIQVFEDEKRVTVINTYLMQVASDYDEKAEELEIEDIAENDYPANAAISYDLSIDDFPEADTYKDEEYVTVTIASGDIITLDRPETVTAAVTEYVHDESVTAGETYLYSAACNDDGDSKVYDLGEDYVLYLDPYGNVLFADGIDAADQYVYIIEFANSTQMTTKAAVQANAYFTDGTNKVIAVDKVNGVKTDSATAIWGTWGTDYDITNSTVTDKNGVTRNAGWYKWTEKDGVYSLTTVTQKAEDMITTAGSLIVDYSEYHTEILHADTPLAPGRLQTAISLGTKSTNFIILEGDGDVRVYTGIKNVPDIISTTGDTSVQVAVDGSYATNVFVDLRNGNCKGGNASSDIVFLLGWQKHGNDVDDDEYYRFKALLNGEETTVKVDKPYVDAFPGGATGMEDTLWMDVEYQSKNYIINFTQVNGTTVADREDFSMAVTNAATVNRKGDVLEFSTSYATHHPDYLMADDYDIFVIDASANSWDTYSIKQLAERDLTAAVCTIYGVMNADGEYTALYIVEP